MLPVLLPCLRTVTVETFDLESKNESMRALRNDLLKEKIALKEHNLVFADNLNGYINKLQSAPLSDNNANTQPIASTPHRELKIPDPPLFSSNWSKGSNLDREYAVRVRDGVGVRVRRKKMKRNAAV